VKQSELFPIAKRAWRRNPRATEAEIALECGLSQHVIAGWDDATPDLITIRSARREIVQDASTGAFQGGSGHFG
jgi:hypothetical protein